MHRVIARLLSCTGRLLCLFSAFSRLIAPGRATYVARSSRNSFYPLFRQVGKTVSIILIN